MLKTKVWKQKVRLLAVASVAALTASACAADLPSGAAEETSQAFALLADEGGTATESRAHAGNKGRFQGQHKGFMFGMMARDLNLSTEQKNQFQALMQSGRENHGALKTELKTFKERVKTQFLTEQFDVSALQAEWNAIQKPDAEALRLKMAEKMHTAWHILTPEQQGKLETKLTALEARFSQAQRANPSKQNAHAGKMLARMTEQLNLSEAQQQTLKSRWEAQQGERQNRRAAFKSVKQTVLQQLKAGASAESLAQSLAPMSEQLDGKSASFLQRLATLHDILNAEQRQKLVDTLGQRRAQFHRGSKR